MMENLELNWIDTVFWVVLAWSTLWGLWRGLIGGVFGIIGLVLAFLTAQKYGAHLSQPTAVLVGESAVSVAIGYVVVFMVALMAFSALTYFLRKMAKTLDLGMADKFGGFLFGVARGGVFVLILVIMLAALPMQKAKAWQESVLLPYLGAVVKHAVAMSALAEYKKYWEFDQNNRPHLNLPAAGTAKAAKVMPEGEQRQQRDQLLDDLNDEFAKQSLHHNEKLTQEALAARKKEREPTFLQALKEAMGSVFQQATCAEGECAAAPEKQ